MPIFTTKIKLISGTDRDYNLLSEELKKKSFSIFFDSKSKNESPSDSAVILSTNQPTLLEVTTSIYAAASRIGKKFSFTVRKEKMPV
jgi:hypothetical protein